MNFERRPVGRGSMLVYTIGRTYLIEQFHSQMATDSVRLAKGPMSQKAYGQLADLQTEMRESGTVYSPLPATTMTLASPAVCWPGRCGIRICRPG